MKKIRKTKIVVTSREVLLTRRAPENNSTELNQFPVCPVCRSPLTVISNAATDEPDAALKEKPINSQSFYLKDENEKP